MCNSRHIAFLLSRVLALLFALMLAGTTLHAQPLNPKCSDRTATGQFVCIIDQPDVTRHETIYPSVQFAPGDVVDILADGCVQTGGVGDTWKRYVNPTGDNSDHLYHGLIRIPSARPVGDGLVRIKDVIGRRQTVTGTGVPIAQLVLHLGYEDDDYRDNGYYSHDDGNLDQCKNDQGHGGPARVIITVFRGPATPPPAESRFDFDVLPNTIDPKRAYDPNFLLYNPHWAWQQSAGNQGKTPDTSICHNFSVRNTVAGIPQVSLSPNFPDCTDQADPGSVDLPNGFNAEICNVGGVFESDSFSGHVNWFPVTVEGHAGWGDESTDDDNTFTFTNDQPGNPLSVNGRPGLHVEFDSDETTKLFASDAWKAFHGAVENDDHDLAKQYFDGHTILTGMFGLDGEHNLKSELHPLFALATKRDNFGSDATHEDWLIFARNRGDEGFCSSRLWDSGFEDYTFRLPWLEGMDSVDVDWNATQFEGTDGTSGPIVATMAPPLPDPGVYVTFHLGPASNTPFIDGSLKLVWTPLHVQANPPTVPGRVAGKAVVRPVGPMPGLGEDEADEVEHKIGAAIAQLPQAQRQSVQQARSVAVAHPAIHRLPRVGMVQRLTAWPGAGARILRRLHAIDAGPATAKLQRDTAQIRTLCAASHNVPVGLPPRVCVSAVRDHR